MGIGNLVQDIFGENAYLKCYQMKRNIGLKISDKCIYQRKKENLQYKMSHEGERCFILGNGPSLNSVDLSLLSKEFIFTVNDFYKNKGYEAAKPNVHLWMDTAYFEMRKSFVMEKTELTEGYQAIAKLNPICFVPKEAYKYIKENQLDSILNINYLDTLNWIDEKNKILFDIDKFITGFHNVVQYAIVIAVYMGFKQIYLLGCDSTAILSFLNHYLEIDSKEGGHSYDANLKEKYDVLFANTSVTELVGDQYKLYLGYKRLYEECMKRNIIIENCCPRTLISEIPKNDFTKVINLKF